MRWLAQIAFQVKSLFSKRKLDEQLSEEIRTHLEMATEANVAAGMTPDEARYAALREFGNMVQVKEHAHDERGWVWLEQFFQDLRYAGRGLRGSPTFTTVAVLTLAVGIGANTALFSVVNALLLRPLPVRAPRELVLFGVTASGDLTRPFPYPLYNKNGPNHTFPFPFYEHFRSENQSLANIAAFGGWAAARPMVVNGAKADESESERIATLEVSGSYFPTLGGMAAVGRLLGESDDEPGHAQPVAVISYALWLRRFGADPAIIGRRLTVDGVSLAVVGVADQGFSGLMVGSPVDLWVPLQLSPQIDQNQPWAGALKSSARPWLCVFGRLKSGVAVASAQSELGQHFQRKLEQIDPRWSADRPNSVVFGLTPAGSGFGAIQSAYKQPVTMLMVMVGVLLLVVCANITGLLLVRGAAREREFAMRSALGASQWRIVTQLMIESLLLAGIGSTLGLGVAWAGTRWLGRFLGNVDLGLDVRVTSFIILVSGGTGIVFGLLPAWRLSRLDLMNACKWASGSSRRLNRALVIIQISLAFVLGIAAILLGRTFQRLATESTGFERDRLLLAPLEANRNAKPQQRLELSRRLTEGFEALPGVQRATAYQGISLLGPFGIENEFEVKGWSPPPGMAATASIVAAGSGFFETMGIALIRGTDFPATPTGALQPIIISEWSARKLFGEANPLGRQIKLGGDFEVAGVAQEIKYSNLREEPKFIFYIPLRTRPSTLQTTMAIRTRAGATVNLAELRAVLWQVDPTASLLALNPARAALSRLTRQERFAAQLSAFFGGFVLILASLGLFGLLAFGVTKRTREIGVRLALGASPRALRRQVMREGLALATIGSFIGAAAAVGLMRFAGSLFYGVSATEPSVYMVVFALLSVASGLACWLPARRAAKVDPMLALRAE